MALPTIAKECGTPVYIYDERTLRRTAQSYRDAFLVAYPRSCVVYAAKAFTAPAIIAMFREEGLGIDVVSGGELYLALRAGMPASDISFHGNNKSAQELREAIDAGVGKIVIDNHHEIDLLESIVHDLSLPIEVMLRINPGVDVHTHKKISTGLADSKFGLPVASDQALAAVERIGAIPNLDLVGYHAHVGSQLFEPDATIASIGELLTFAKAMRDLHGMEMRHLSPGGGFGIAYVDADAPLQPDTWAKVVSRAVIEGCAERGLSLPTLTVEPGRALVGPAGVALYTVGALKELPGIRTYASVDGGMADNIRPAMYEATYSARIANRRASGPRQAVTIAGKYCESGDVLIEHVSMPRLSSGDLLAIPAAGAYCLAMASNYNCALRPPVVVVKDGSTRVIRRRETYADLTHCDVETPSNLSSA